MGLGSGEGEVVRESGERGKGRQEGVGRGKREGPPTKHSNISPASKHSDCSPALKKFLPRFPFSPPPFPPSFLIYHFRQTKLDHYYIMY